MSRSFTTSTARSVPSYFILLSSLRGVIMKVFGRLSIIYGLIIFKLIIVLSIHVPTVIVGST